MLKDHKDSTCFKCLPTCDDCPKNTFCNNGVCDPECKAPKFIIDHKCTDKCPIKMVIKKGDKKHRHVIIKKLVTVGVMDIEKGKPEQFISGWTISPESA